MSTSPPSLHDSPGSHLPQEDESTLARLKPSLRSTLPIWLLYVATAVAITWLLEHFHVAVVWVAQRVANLLGDAFPYDTWYLWVLTIIWIGCLIRPAHAVLLAMTTEYEFTNRRLRYTRGILHRQRDQLELARIRDMTATRRLSERLLGLGTLRLDTVDRSHPVLDIPGQTRVYELKNWIHNLNTKERERIGYREFEGTQGLG